ncbi:hypothetical protein [Lacticaseibacillus sp. GG6-2]
MNQIELGMWVHCEPNGNMEHAFDGRVVKIYECAALVEIKDYHPKDALNARELLYRTVISFKRMVPAAIENSVDEAIG